jgi:predicted MFS family arabinose efflux permease
MATSQKIFTHDFILAFVAQLALTSVMQLLIPTLPIYLKSLGSTEIEIGILVGMLGLASLASRPLVGRALVRVREKTFMIAGALLHVVSSTAYLVTPPFWPLLIVRLMQGAAFGFFHTASTTYVVGISAPSYRARILGYFSLTMNIAAAIAPPLGILLIDRFGFFHLFVVCSVLSFFMLLATAVLRKSDVRLAPDPEEKKGFLLSRKAVPPSIISFFGLFVWASVSTFFPLYARGHGMENPGLFFTVMAIMLILGRTLGGRLLDMRSKQKLIIPCIVSSIVAMFLLAYSTTLPMFLVVAVLWGAGHAFLMPALLGYSLELSGEGTGPVVATFYAISDMGVFLGPLFMGFVAEYTSYRLVFLCLSFLSCVSLAYFYYFSRSIKGDQS